MINIRFAAKPDSWAEYEPHLRAGLNRLGLAHTVATDFAPQDVDYVVYAPNSDVQDFTLYTRCKAVLSLWAGVETIVSNETLTQPLARMVDHGLTQGMVEWVCGHALRHHLGMDAHIVNPGNEWKPLAPPLAANRPVCVLGLGALGAACATALAGFGFPVRGWSRNPKTIDGVACYSGQSGLVDALDGAEIVVLLLPQTAQTENILNAKTLGRLARGAFVLNPGRGPLIDDDALVEALDSGQIAHATLDVFRQEPLPATHVYWTHPKVTVTPHVASETRAETAAQVIVENIRRGEAGEPFLHLVDRESGY